ncbi:hypothetical protein QTP88_011539 [Uroleucon formosanum]
MSLIPFNFNPDAEGTDRYLKKNYDNSVAVNYEGRLNNSNWILVDTVKRYTCYQQPFFRDKVTDTHGKCSIIFVCSTLIRKVDMYGSNELHADATFKVMPSTPPSRQLFIMHLIYQNHTEEAYTLLLRKCKELFPLLMAVNTMTDFESGLLNAFKSVYPDADQNSCCHYYLFIYNIKVISESDDDDHEAINIPQLDNSTSADNNVTNEYIPNNIVSNDATEDDGETFVVEIHNISNYINDTIQI